jgi:hypothetical protein
MRITRRGLLMGIGGATLALPMLPSVMGERVARAGGTPKPDGFFFLHLSSNGSTADAWMPFEDNLTWTQLAPDVRHSPLSGPGPISKVLGATWAPLKDRICVIRKGLSQLDTSAGGHNPNAMLGGSAGHRDQNTVLTPMPTLDSVFAAALYDGTTPLVRSFGATAGYEALYAGALSVTLDGQENGLAGTPVDLYEQVFGNFVPNGDPTEAQRRNARLATVDRVSDEYKYLRNNPRLGSADRAALDDHVAYMADLQKRLSATVACTKPGEPAPIVLNDVASLSAQMDLFFDVVEAAVRCGVKVFCLSLAPATDICSYSFLPGVTQDHHTASHSLDYGTNSTAVNDITLIQAFLNDKAAQLLLRLDGIQDPVTGESFLDTSVGIVANPSGMAPQDPHVPFDLPVVLTGRAFTPGVFDLRKVHLQADGQEVGDPIIGPGFGPLDMFGLFKGRLTTSLYRTLFDLFSLKAEDFRADKKPYWGDGPEAQPDAGYNWAEAQQPIPFLARSV